MNVISTTKVDEALPIRRHHAQQMAHTLRAMLLPGFRFRHLGADVQRQQRRQRAQPEHGTPTPRRQHRARRDGRQQVADGVAALQNSAEDAAPTRGGRFHGQRSAHAPLSTHADAKKGAQDQEHGVVGRETASHFDNGKVDDVGHQRNAASKAIGKHAKQQRANGPKR